MKRITYLFVTLIVCLLPLTAHAEWYNNITFVVGSNASTPITVRYNGQTYKVYDSTTINTTGNTYTPSATDANGNSMKYEVSSSSESRGSNKYHTYVYTFYPRSNYSSGNSGGGYNSGNSGNNSSNNWGTDPRWGEIGGGLSHEASRHAQHVDGKAYPGLHLFTGISKAYGEFARLRVTYSAMSIYAGIGKDWLFNGINKDKLLWHAGIGGLYHFGGKDPWGDIGGAVTVAQTAAWENVSLMIDCDFIYWFGRWKRVGCFAGAGAGFADVKDFGKEKNSGGFAWNLEFGLVLKIANF